MFAGMLAAGAAAFAAETTTFSYDALGRLTSTTVAGTVNNGVQTSTTYDPAGNRTALGVTGAASSGSPTLSVSGGSAIEGNPVTFTVTRTGPTTTAVGVSYATSDGSALAGSDYTATSATLSFAVGETSKSVTVGILDDIVAEPTETFTLTLSSPTGGAVLGVATATGTITDNDQPPPSFAIANAPTVTEGGTLVYTVTKTGSTSATYTVNFSTADGTANAGSDYTANSGSLIFLAGDTSKTIPVTTNDDLAVEPAETVLVNLTGASGGATITTSQASGTINDNDLPPPSFAIGNAQAVTEGGMLVYTVSKTGSTNTNFSVNFATANGSAMAGADYTAQTGSLSFLPGDTSKTISIQTIDDLAVEPAETVLVNLSGATGGATITTSQGSGTINDNDVANQNPIALNDTATPTIPKCGHISWNVLSNDSDPDHDPISVVSVTNGAKGTAEVEPAGTVGYDNNGTGGSDGVTYTISDGRGGTASAVLTISIQTTGQCQ